MLSQFIAFPVAQHSPQSALDDRGVGVYGAGTFTFGGKLDGSIGVRADHENKKANLNTFFAPAIAPPAAVNAERDFTDVSPQFTLAYHAMAGKTVYVTAARGFKAGGFNPASPAGSEAYGEEHNWNGEGGVKTSWLGQRVTLNGAVFYITWRDLQVNVPNPFVPAQFYIANAASATSKGFEIELSARPAAGVDLFGSVGYTRARFGGGSVSGAQTSAETRCPTHPTTRPTPASSTRGPSAAPRASMDAPTSSATASIIMTMRTLQGRAPTRWPTSAPACAARTCSWKDGYVTPSIRVTS